MCNHPGTFRGQVCSNCNCVVGDTRSQDVPQGNAGYVVETWSKEGVYYKEEFLTWDFALGMICHSQIMLREGLLTHISIKTKQQEAQTP